MVKHGLRRPTDQKPPLPDQKKHLQNTRRHKPDTPGNKKTTTPTQMAGKGLAQRRVRPSNSSRRIQVETGKGQVDRSTPLSGSGPAFDAISASISKPHTSARATVISDIVERILRTQAAL